MEITDEIRRELSNMTGKDIVILFNDGHREEYKFVRFEDNEFICCSNVIKIDNSLIRDFIDK